MSRRDVRVFICENCGHVDKVAFPSGDQFFHCRMKMLDVKYASQTRLHDLAAKAEREGWDAALEEAISGLGPKLPASPDLRAKIAERIGLDVTKMFGEERARFLDYINDMVEFWMTETRVTDMRGKLEGLAFSILVGIDGESLECGPYALRKLDEEGNEGEDIGGSLHNDLSARRQLTRA